MARSNRRTGKPLKRALGGLDCALLVIGAIIGSGIFLTPGSIAQVLGDVRAVFLVWIAGGVLTFCGAVSFAELGSAFPEAGGIYVFLDEAYGRLPAFLYGWCAFLVIIPGAIATLANAFAIYLSYLAHWPPGLSKAVAIALIALLVTFNYRGIHFGAVVQNLLTCAKIGSLLAIASVLFFMPGGGTSMPAPETASFTFPSLSAIGLAMIAVLWSYDGWHLVTFAAGEVHEPRRNLTRGLLGGTLVVIGLYLVVNVAYFRVLTLQEIASSASVAGDAMEKALGPIGGSLVAGAILLSISGAMNSNILAGPRVPYAMARQGLFFRAVTFVHPRFQVPSVAIVLTGVMASLLTLIGTFEQLFNYVIFVSWVFYGLGAAGVIVLRIRRPELDRPYRAWGYPVVPLIFAVAAAALVANSVFNDFIRVILGIAVILTGLPAYWFWQSRSANSDLI